MTPIKDLSINPFEFIRQCKHERHFSSKESIAEQAWMHGPEFAGRVLHILNKVGCAEMVFFQSQRKMVRELAKEMLGKILYTQQEFAGKLIALMDEFGVGVAFIEEDRNFLEPSIIDSYVVISYVPGAWGERQIFSEHVAAVHIADKINNFGNFNL